MSVSYRCDRCGAEAPFHMTLDIDEVVIEQEGQPKAIDKKTQALDLCVPCMGRAVGFLTTGIGFAAKRAWIAAALTKD